MSELKNLAILLMYFYIFMIAINDKNIIAVSIIILLTLNHIKNLKLFFKLRQSIRERLISQRETFINSLSHDLRIPTIAQIRALELLKENKFGKLNDSQIEVISNIEESCKCILNLLSLMINTYSIENNNYKLIYEKFNLSEVIISCFDELLPKAAEKKITFEFKGKDRNITITADKEELKKVIFNILSDSLIHSIAGEKVSVAISSFNDKVYLTIKGNNENLFYTNSQFTSIGESIRLGFCKKIIETHHGKIIENNDKNSFSFELPVLCTQI